MLFALNALNKLQGSKSLFMLLVLMPHVLTACVQNTNDNCQIGALPDDTGTYYYASDDTLNFQLIGEALGTCDSGSSADVSLYYGFNDDNGGTLVADCGCLPLDGSIYTIECPNTPRNTYPEGGYHFVIGESSDYYGVIR